MLFTMLPQFMSLIAFFVTVCLIIYLIRTTQNESSYKKSSTKPWWAEWLSGEKYDFVDWESCLYVNFNDVFKASLLLTIAELEKQTMLNVYPYVKKNLLNREIPIRVRAAACMYLYNKTRGAEYTPMECTMTSLLVYYTPELHENALEEAAADTIEQYGYIFNLSRPSIPTKIKKEL